MPGSPMQNNMFNKTQGFVQDGNPFPVTSCGRRRNDGSPLAKRKRKPDVRKTTKGKSRNFRTVKEGAGMTAAGVRKYKAKNPGSKLQTAVTGKVKPVVKLLSVESHFVQDQKVGLENVVKQLGVDGNVNKK